MSKSNYTHRLKRMSDDKIVKVSWTFEELEDHRIFGTRFKLDDGSEATLQVERIKKPKRVSLPGSTWPMTSLALACHPSQVQKFRKQARDEGHTGVEIRDDGVVKLSDQKALREYSRTRGVCMKNAGYGDPVPTAY